MNKVRVYTKRTERDIYPDGLARSMHFSLERDGEVTELNHGYGVLFARGSVDGDGCIEPKTLRDPEICRGKNGGFFLRAVLLKRNGEEEENSPRIFWRSEDLISFEEIHASGVPEDTPFSDLLEITDAEAELITAYWNPPVPKALTSFPKARGFADPVFFRWEDKWYFIATNDNRNDIGLFIREGESIEELLSDDAPMYCILDRDEELGFIQNFWAPEFHVIGGELYILFAVSGTGFGPCCHLMKLKKGGKLTDPASYETPVAVKRKDGSVLTIPEYKLTEEQAAAVAPSTETSVDFRYGISLDMTYLKDEGRSYMLWSFRQFMGTPRDSGSMIMIAEVSEEEPWRLRTDPVIISRPVYGYENAGGHINNEAPFVYRRGSRIHVNYSGGDARGYLYIVNLLSAESGSDLLDPKNWKKRVTPILNFKTIPGVYGPGHNSWFRDENGKDWVVFHAVERMEDKKIAVGVFEYPEML